MAYTYYHKRIEQGLCGRCGKQPHEPNKKLCESCRNINNANVKQSQKFRIEMGFCPKCGKEKLYGDEKVCLICKANSRKNILSNEQLIKKREYDRQYARKRRLLAKENGLCVICGKQKRKLARQICGYCSEKARIRYMARKENEYDRE